MSILLRETEREIRKGDKMSDKYEELRGKAKDNRDFRQTTIQLYEKGLLSDQSLLDILGFDSDEEIKRKKYDIKKPSLQELGSATYKKDYIDIKTIRIENARRNVEAILRFNTNSWTEDKEFFKKLKVSAENNLKIMDEVGSIK